MIKNLLICASAVGLTALVVYLLCKKEKTNDITTNLVDDDINIKSESHCSKPISENSNVEEMYQAKRESVQTVYERHSEAGSIMKDAYSNIMEDFVEGFSGEEDTNAKDENKSVIIDSESVSVMQEIDWISDELDDLLK